jgi:DNA repair protein RadC
MFNLPSNELFAVAELKAVWSKKPLKVKDRPVISSSRDVYDLFLPLYPEIDLYESFWIALLSRNNRVLGFSNISVGGVSGTVADPKKIFQMALLGHASAIILIHNHPSGNTSPSAQDVSITKKCVEAGRFLDIPVMDHVIFTESNRDYSFNDEGML